MTSLSNFLRAVCHKRYESYLVKHATYSNFKEIKSLSPFDNINNTGLSYLNFIPTSIAVRNILIKPILNKEFPFYDNSDTTDPKIINYLADNYHVFDNTFFRNAFLIIKECSVGFSIEHKIIEKLKLNPATVDEQYAGIDATFNNLKIQIKSLKAYKGDHHFIGSFDYDHLQKHFIDVLIIHVKGDVFVYKNFKTFYKNGKLKIIGDYKVYENLVNS